MTDAPIRIVTLSGSTRADSLNTRLALAAGRAFAAAGAEVDHVELGRFPLPLYDGDLEERDGAPEAALRLHERIAAADAVVIASPEYNGGPSGVLKNTIDWVSRADMFAFRPRRIGLLSASPGSKGGAGGLEILRMIFTHMGCTIHEPLSVAKAFESLVDRDVAPDAVEGLGAWAEAFVANTTPVERPAADAQ